VLVRINHQLSEHAAEVVTKGAHGVNGMGRGGAVAQATALGFAIERHALAAAFSHLSWRARLEHPLDCRSDCGRVKPRQEALDGGLVRSSVAPKAQGTSHVAGLAGGPFGYGEHAGVVGKHSDDGQ